MTTNSHQVITVTLNPAIDETVTISNFAPGAVNRVEAVRCQPGGKGVNVASALADYGNSVAATGFLGRENVAVFEELLERKDIDDHFVRIDGQTRHGIKIHDPERRETTDINFPGAAPTPYELDTLRERFIELCDVDDLWVVLAGSVPPGVDSTIYRELIELCHGRNQKVIVDTSGEPLAYAIEAKPQAIKPNIHELEALVRRPLPSRDDVIAAARELITRGIGLVTVSMGEKGALFITADEIVTALPPSIHVRSTVGAGDAMVAGIVAAQLREFPLADCARLATAFSLDALGRGESGVSTNGSLEAFMHEVTLS